MATVSISDLSRNASRVVETVERTRRPAIVTNHGRVVAALIPVDQDRLEDFILAHAPEFVADMAAADDDLRGGRVQRLGTAAPEGKGKPRRRSSR